MRFRLYAAAAAALFLAGCLGAGAPPSRSSAAHPPPEAPEITGLALRAELAGFDPPLVLDVRTPGEYAEGHIPGAVLLPVCALRGDLHALGRYRNRPVVTVCEIGARSAEAARILLASGFADVRNYRDGMAAWRRTGPVVRGVSSRTPIPPPSGRATGSRTAPRRTPRTRSRRT